MDKKIIDPAQCTVEGYLERIGYEGHLDNSYKTLAAIQEAHLKAVPYENLDIRYGIPLSLVIPDLYHKIVIKRRGGYCFELNALFRWLLLELGFPVTNYMARFLRDEAGIPMRRHQVLKVETEDGASYICDVGVGGNIPTWPYPLVLDEVYHQDNGSYRIQKDDFLGWVLEEIRHGQWSQLYSFTEELQLPIDFIMPSFWCEYSPDSPFTQRTMVSLRTPEGRVTVADEEFRIYTEDDVKTFVPKNDEDFRCSLDKYFGIVLDT
ncbi:MAG TPA: acetyltransferase [Clostridiales bacterium]|nr:arylamine N-acetyltransferase [Clostridia bacterium]HCS73967.1 acetyltransferase [Clostridiales bacterium]